MSCKNPFFTLPLLLFLLLPGRSKVQTITINGMTISGHFCCTPTSNCPGEGIPNVTVSLNCTILGVTTTIDRATTCIDGSFNMSVPAVAGLIIGLHNIPCVAYVLLPLDSGFCPFLYATHGILESAIKSIGTLIMDSMGII